MERIRLNKYLASRGICSRRDADKLIASGTVLVNGVRAELGTVITEADEVWVRGKILEHKDASDRFRRVVLAYYKPVGVVCTERDKHADKIVTEQINYPVRVTYAGRLDKDSEGLLLLTNDGELIQKLMKASNHHEKEYVVKTVKPVTPEFLKQMEKGVYLKELDVTTRPCQVEQTGKCSFRIILTQGYNRQIRRMCEVFGFQVQRLKRIRILNIRLDGLKTGEYREVTPTEMKKLLELLKDSSSETVRNVHESET